MNLQLITTREDLQQVISLAVNNAFLQTSHNSVPPKEPIEIIDTRELCERLAITEPTVIRWRKKGKIPYLQIGSSIRFNYQAVIVALEIVVKRRGIK